MDISSAITKCLIECRDYIVIGGISAMGAISRYASDVAEGIKGLSWPVAIASIITGMFAASLTFAALGALSFPDLLVFFFTGIAAWGGYDVVIKYHSIMWHVIELGIDKLNKFMGK